MTFAMEEAFESPFSTEISSLFLLLPHFLFFLIFLTSLLPHFLLFLTFSSSSILIPSFILPGHDGDESRPRSGA